MKPNTALGFVLSGLALNFLHSSTKLQRRIAKGLAIAIALLGLLILSQHIFGWNLGIDQLLFSDKLGAIKTSSPGRMSPVSALNFSLIGCALWLAAHRNIHSRKVQVLALITSLTSLQVLIGYIYGVKPLFGLSSFTHTAIHTAITFFLLSIGTLFVSPTDGLMSLVISNSAGGMTARVLLPAAIAIPFILGWLRVYGEKLGLFDMAFGLSLHVIGNVIAFTGLVWYCAKGLYRLDIKRQQAEAALRYAYAELEVRVKERTAELSQANQVLEQEIAERMRTVTALHKSFREFADMKFALDQSSIVAITDAKGIITEVNNKFCELSGYSRQELIGQTHRIINSGYHPKTFFGQMWATISQGEVWQGEIKNQAKDGTYYWVATTIVPFLDDRCKPYQYIAIRSDITNRKQAEEALRESEERFRRAILDAPLPIILHAEGGEILQINRAWTEITGYCPEEIPTIADWAEKAYGTHQEQMRDAIALLYQLTERTAQGEYSVTTNTGEKRTWDFYSAPLGKLRDRRSIVMTMAIDTTERKQAAIALRESEARAKARAKELEIFMEAVPVAVWVAHDPQCHYMTNNRAAYNMMRRKPGGIMTATPATGGYPFDFKIQKNGEDIPPYELPMQKAARTGQSVEDGFEFVFDDGEVKFIDSRSVPLLDDSGNVSGVIGAFWDVTELQRALSDRQQAEEALRQSEERFRHAILDAPLPIILHTENGEILEINHTWTEITGYSIEDIPTIADWTERAYGSRQEQVQSDINRLYRLNSRAAEGEYPIRTSTGETRIWDFYSAPLGHLPDGRSLVISTAFDVTQRKQAESQLLRNAFYDGLTGLPNRALFMEQLNHSLQKAKRHQDYLFAVLFLDLDRFKIINDSLGHLKGDQFLISIARILENCIRATDIAARLGGDEFTILLEEIQDVADAIKVAERIQQELRSPLKLDGQEVFTSASIGIALSSTLNYEQPEQLLRDADTAMYQAKALGKSRYALFHPEMYATALTRLQLEADLRRAIEHQEFQLYYQPIVSLTSGRIIGFEALMRWQHPERGLVNPVDFIPLAEETGLIVEMGYWALLEACRQMQAWQQAYPHRSLEKMSVNLSARQFCQPNLIEQIRNILQSTGLNPRNLALEITESVIVENGDEAVAILSKLRDLGIEILIDDFGTGYSSLGRLYSFPISELKIDRSFVNPMTTNKRNLDIIEIIVALADKLGMSAIAEGVETQEQLAILRKLRCESVQGYFFSQPLDSSKAAALIAANPQWC
ncbi:EAL domain-containing protein [Tolypothrix sp. PCC 7910]|uniref:bifunctional diguanylate cyclase/phosphodiesterase n=1 Tax=Tolypothrix sp. PCC 7910 TaxID=2099387 RepID=UPI0014277DBA|nr:bifunctional diguanylate cyclase/phosphodiesterase [Tolypothrix sp. PCC 7910]QIR35364.1 EAL domain-containing protein [Tolypothrix sp. PCC 7910]